jgi:hypothetical protein
MTIRLNPRWLLISTLLFSLQLGRAQVLPGTLSFDLGSSNAADTKLWDVGGNYQVNLLLQERHAVLPIQLAFTLVQDSAGKLTSPVDDVGSVVLSDNDSVLAILYRVTGKVSGSGGIARVHFSIRMSGSGTLAGQNVDSFTGSFSVDAETDPTTLQLMGSKSSKFSGNFPGLSSVKGKAELVTDLPQGDDGSWNLSMQLVALSKLTGTGVITTPHRNMGLDLSGSTKNGVFKVKARGANDVPNTTSGIGSSATFLLADPFDSIVVKGKLLGQKVSFSSQQQEN